VASYKTHIAVSMKLTTYKIYGPYIINNLMIGYIIICLW